MAETPFFRRDGDAFVPTEVGRGPWDPKSLHGRLIAGLIAFEIERRHGEPDLQPARLTVDMHRLPGLDPVTVTTRVVRDGRRLRLVEAEFISGGRAAGLGVCQLLRKSEAPEGKVWSPPSWDAPPPAAVPDPPQGPLGDMWAIKPIEGHMGRVGRRRLWMAETRELVDGAPPTPFVRAALAADFASPFANAGDQGLAYINSDLSLYLHRLPVTEWIGFEVTDHGATDGVAVASCRLYDEAGAIGQVTVAALARARMAHP